MSVAFRSMKSEPDRVCPVVGDSGTKLGVRERDLPPDINGLAQPKQGGMSVISSIAGFRRRIGQLRFPPDYVPRRLAENGKIPGATGSNRFHIFKIGEGEFCSGNLNEELFVEQDQEDHATVQPMTAVPYEQFRTAIAATRDHWVSGEHDE